MADPKIRLKRSSVEGKIPTSDQVPLGEIALNTYDGYLYASKNVGVGTTVIAINPFRVGTGTNTYNAYFTAGNVGIGSEIPTTKLDVDGTVTATSFAGSGANLTGLTGASAATYGGGFVIPVITVDANGRITGISTAANAGASSGSGLSQIADDTTPQLGGNLDVNGKNINFGNSASASDDRLNFGAGTDLSIYHDGTHSYIDVIPDSANQNHLYIRNNVDGDYNSDIFIQAKSGETSIRCYDDSSVELYYDNAAKLTTTDTGFTVTGTGLANATGGGWKVNDNKYLTAGTGDDFQIYHNGTSTFLDNDTGHIFIRNNVDGDVGGNIYLRPHDNEEGIIIYDDSSVELYYDNAAKLTTTDTGFTVTGTGLANAVGGGWKVNDDRYLTAGTGDDFQIYHNGTSTFLDNDTGHLFIRNNVAGDVNGNIYLRPHDNEEGIIIHDDGAVELYYDNVSKLQTTATGVNITGALNVTTLDFLDDQKMRFGTGLDAEIYHDGTNTYFDNDTGNLFIRNNVAGDVNGDIYIMPHDNENGIRIYDDGGVELYYDNSSKFTTTDTGFTVTGTGLGNFKANDSSTITAGTGDDFQIYHNGTNTFLDNDTGNLFIRNNVAGDVNGNIYLRPHDNEEGIIIHDDGAVELYYDNSSKFTTTTTGFTVTGTGLGNFKVNDNNYLTAGTGDDFQIYHNGTNTFLDNDTGHLFIRNNVDDDTNKNIYIQPKSGENSIICYDDDAVELYFDNSAKFQTTSTGVSVTGIANATGFSTTNGTSSQFLKADGSVDGSTYLTSYTETDPVVAAINGIVKSDGTTISAATAGTDYLTDISQDTSPQLGGNLDLNSNTINGTGSINITGGASFTGNVTIGGTLTYEDVTNIDSIGLITARSGINATGVVTATSFVKSSNSGGFLKADGTEDTNTYLTSFTETNDLSSAVTWANVPNANITESSVTQHQAALSITESQISDLQSYLTSYTETQTLNDVLGLGNTSTTGLSVGVVTTTALKGFDYLQAPHGTTVNYAVTVAAKTAAHRYNGSGSSNGYLIDGVESPFLTFTPGRTYRFTLSSSDMTSHPFRFYLEADKTTAYTTNVTSTGTYTEIVVTDTTPTVLHYQCSAHGYMGNAVQVNSNKVNTPYQIDGLNGANITGVTTSTSFVKTSNSGGFLKADGTEDTNTYLTSYTETDPVVGAINGIVKANGSGTISAATAGHDYLTPSGDGSSLTGLTGASAATYGSAGATPVIVVDSDGRITGISTVATAGSGSGSGISSVSEDTTPQLGGTLETNGNLIDFGDSSGATDDRLRFGAGQDLQIWHNGANSYIAQQSDVGDLYLTSSNDDNDVVIQTDNGFGSTTDYFRADGSTGEAKLFYYGSEKIKTTNTGVTITGTATATEFSGGGSNLTGLTGASAATYGSSTVTPVITVDANGRITTISTATISGGSGGGSSSTRTVNRYVATQSQTLFPASGTISYSVGYLDVYLNGSRLDSTEFTATNGTTVTLGTGASANDIVELVAFTNVSLTNVTVVNDTSPQLGGNLDLNSNNITGTGNINITGTATVSGSQVATQNDAIAFAIALG